MRILLIEDDEKLCDALSFQLEKEGHKVDLCHDGRDGLELLLEDAHDMVLLDRMLPTMNGLMVLQRARKRGIKTPVIMITALGELFDRVEGLDNGADDYLVKPFDYEELSARIRSLGRRSGKWEDEKLFSYGDLSYDGEIREISGPNGAVILSGREARMLEVFIQSPGETIRRMALLYRVWGPDAEVEEGNIDTYVHFLRKHLSQVGSRLALKTVRGVGYSLEDDGDVS